MLRQERLADVVGGACARSEAGQGRVASPSVGGVRIAHRVVARGGLIVRYEQASDQVRVSRESRLRNGSYEYGQINVNSAGFDDLITRGNGVLWLPPNFNSYFEYDRPRKGNWSWPPSSPRAAADSRATARWDSAPSSSPRIS